MRGPMEHAGQQETAVGPPRGIGLPQTGPHRKHRLRHPAMEGRENRVSHGACRPSCSPSARLGLCFLISEMGMTAQTPQAVGSLSGRGRGRQRLRGEAKPEMLPHSPEL